MLITLYARKEPTTDAIAIEHGLGHKNDVVFYKDEACTQRYCRWTWHMSPPRKNRKSVILNCYRWAIQWLADVPNAPSAAKPA
jgi:hypothetical protein